MSYKAFSQTTNTANSIFIGILETGKKSEYSGRSFYPV